MKLTTEQLERLEKLGDFQTEMASKKGFSVKSVIGFEANNCYIIHPTRSECNMHKVDPVEYYGESFLKSQFMNYLSQ